MPPFVWPWMLPVAQPQAVLWHMNLPPYWSVGWRHGPGGGVQMLWAVPPVLTPWGFAVVFDSAGGSEGAGDATE